MSVSSSWALASDAELITAVRSGESAAFGVLYERHAGAARAVAHQYSNAPADAEDAVADAFQRVFSTIQGGAGPDVAFRAYLFTVVRRVAMTRIEGTRRVQTTDDMATFEAAIGPAPPWMVLKTRWNASATASSASADALEYWWATARAAPACRS